RARGNAQVAEDVGDAEREHADAGVEGRSRAIRAGQRQQAAQEDQDHAPDDGAALAARAGDVRDVPHGGDDVDAADLPGGADDRDEGDDDAQAVGDDEAARLDVRLDVEVVTDDVLQAGGDAHRRDDSQRRADESSENGVARALGDELLDELAALLPDRAGHAHLGAALGGEHGEDQDDQQDAGGDREEAEDQEEAGEGLGVLLGHLNGVLLEG